MFLAKLRGGWCHWPLDSDFSRLQFPRLRGAALEDSVPCAATWDRKASKSGKISQNEMKSHMDRGRARIHLSLTNSCERQLLQNHLELRSWIELKPWLLGWYLRPATVWNDMVGYPSFLRVPVFELVGFVVKDTHL